MNTSSSSRIELVSPTSSLQGGISSSRVIKQMDNESSINNTSDTTSTNSGTSTVEVEEASSKIQNHDHDHDNSVSKSSASNWTGQITSPLNNSNSNVTSTGTNNSKRNNSKFKQHHNRAGTGAEAKAVEVQVKVKRSQSNSIKKALLKFIPPRTRSRSSRSSRSQSHHHTHSTRQHPTTTTIEEQFGYDQGQDLDLNGSHSLGTNNTFVPSNTGASTDTYDEHNIELELGAAYKDRDDGHRHRQQQHHQNFHLESITTSKSKLDAAVILKDKSHNHKGIIISKNNNKKKKKMGRFSPCFGIGNESSDSDSLPESAPESSSPLAVSASEASPVSSANTKTITNTKTKTKSKTKSVVSPRSKANDKSQQQHAFAKKCSIKQNSQLCVTASKDDNDNDNEVSASASASKSQSGAGWCPLPANYFSVRKGPNYDRNKKKAPSGPSLYESVHCHAFRSEKRTSLMDTLPLPSMGQLFPSTSGTLPKIDDERIPHLIIIQYQIPSEQPSMVKNTDDGKGAQVVFYFVASEDFCQQSNAFFKDYDDEEVSGAVKLFTEWCANCEESKAWRSRFKTIAKVRQENADSGSFLRRFNGKPMLVKESSSVQRGTTEEGMRFLEYNVNMHKWAYVPKKGVVSLIPSVMKMTIDIGFTIEAREDSEMPETILASITMDKIKPSEVVDLPSDLHVEC